MNIPGGLCDPIMKTPLELLDQVLRPFTKIISPSALYNTVTRAVDLLQTLIILLRRISGRFGARLSPIDEYSYLEFSRELNLQWAILDTFDMYSPAPDHPQSLATVRRWFADAGFQNIEVRYGLNGVVGTGTRSTAVEGC